MCHIHSAVTIKMDNVAPAIKTVAVKEPSVVHWP